MDSQQTGIRITCAALDDEDDQVVLVGNVDNGSLHRLKVDKTYQRKNMERVDLYRVVADLGQIPPVLLGMRGQHFHQDGEDIVLDDPVYIIDGLQRISSTLRVMEISPEIAVKTRAIIYFDTSPEWERAKFAAWNLGAKKLSPNILLRNAKDEAGVTGIAALHGLTKNKTFPLYERVCWEQSMARQHLITAMILCKATVALHSHKVGRSPTNINDIKRAIQLCADKFGLERMRANVHVLFDLVEDCWGLKNIEFRQKSPQVKETFLQTLSSVFSDHGDFWDQDAQTHFFVPKQIREKLARFPIHDPHIANLCSCSGQARPMIYNLIVEHLNKGRHGVGMVRRDAATWMRRPLAAA